jgi:hypothetical protein
VSEINVELLIVIVLIVAIETIGCVQWLKNYVVCKNKRFYAVVSLLVLIPCAFVHTHLFPEIWETVFDIYFLSLAVIQLAWDVIVKSVPNLVTRVLFKKLGDGKADESEG